MGIHFDKKKTKNGIIVVSAGYPKTHNVIDFLGQDKEKPKYYLFIEHDIFKAGSIRLEKKTTSENEDENLKQNLLSMIQIDSLGRKYRICRECINSTLQGTPRGSKNHHNSDHEMHRKKRFH